jgi:hypothetical protein
METATNHVAGQAGGWLPLLVLPTAAIACGQMLSPWAFMWALSFALYFSLKWLTWWQARFLIVHPAWRSVAYLLAWPGMDADAFLNATQNVPSPSPSQWLWVHCLPGGLAIAGNSEFG